MIFSASLADRVSGCSSFMVVIISSISEGICDSADMNYFRLNNISFKSKAQVIRYLHKGLAKKQTEYYFKLEGHVGIKNTYKAVEDEINKFCQENGIKGKKIHNKLNDNMKTIWIKIV